MSFDGGGGKQVMTWVNLLTSMSRGRDPSLVFSSPE